MYSPAALAEKLSDGILAFPATAFDRDNALDIERTAAHISELAAERPVALVSGGGAGEMFSLNEQEFASLTRLAVDNAGPIPLIAGAGYGLGIAIRMAQLAERAGAQGILLFPPYLMTPDQAGLSEYIGAVCRAVGIGVIAYSRNNGVLTASTALRLADEHPNFVGVKDGIGDFETILAIKHRAGNRLVVINGVPTAEILAAQCFAVGVRSYSSAVFTFLPRVAKRYYTALQSSEHEMVDRLMRQFYLPLIDLRNRRPGYAVAIVKAGLQAVGRSAGGVRAPLHDLTPDEMAQLEALIQAAGAIVEG